MRYLFLSKLHAHYFVGIQATSYCRRRSSRKTVKSFVPLSIMVCLWNLLATWGSGHNNLLPTYLIQGRFNHDGCLKLLLTNFLLSLGYFKICKCSTIKSVSLVVGTRIAYCHHYASHFYIHSKLKYYLPN